VVDDGAHNEEATAALAATLRTINREKYIIMGMLADKDYEESLAHIGKEADHIYCVPIDNPRALTPEAFDDVVKAVNAVRPFACR